MRKLTTILASIVLAAGAVVGTAGAASANWYDPVSQTCRYKVVIEDGMAFFRLVCEPVPYTPPVFNVG